MSLPRQLKVRRTDYRQPGAANSSPLERAARPEAAAWDELSAKRRAETLEHDKMVAGMSEPVLRAAALDLGKRRCWDRKDPIHCWTLDRLAALARAISKLPRQAA